MPKKIILLVCIWGDKSPKNTYKLDDIHSVFPNAKYIHIIRHGADVVHSFLKSGLRNDLVQTAYKWQRAVNLAQKFGSDHPDI